VASRCSAQLQWDVNACTWLVCLPKHTLRILGDIVFKYSKYRTERVIWQTSVNGTNCERKCINKHMRRTHRLCRTGCTIDQFALPNICVDLVQLHCTVYMWNLSSCIAQYICGIGPVTLHSIYVGLVQLHCTTTTSPRNLYRYPLLLPRPTYSIRIYVYIIQHTDLF
jgi:hypothetical protein